MKLATDLLFDTHVHLDLLPSHFNLQEEIEHAVERGVCRFLIPGVDPSDWSRILSLAETVPGVLAAPGVHPLAAQHWQEQTRSELTRLLEEPKVVAIGEIGLDGFLETPAMAIQEATFRGQLGVARDTGTPVLLHCRKATGRLLAILKEEGADAFGGIWHGFSGSRETAMAAIELGFALGFGGTVTWPEARRAPETLLALPAEWIVLESDAPDQTPHPHRGQPNRPAYLELVAERVADLRGWSLEKTTAITTANARRVLRLD